MNSLISFKNVSLSFEDEVLKDVNIKFFNNNLYVIQGESGSGKTSILNLINHSIKPTNGTIEMSSNLKISTMYAENSLFNNLTGRENLYLACDDNNKINDISNKLNINYLLDEKVKKYSQGEYQKMALARALLYDADVYLIDEIASNLDDENNELVFDLLEVYSKEKLVIVVSNNDYDYSKYNCFKIEDNRVILVSENIVNVDVNNRINKKPKLNFKKCFLFTKSLLKGNLVSYGILLLLIVLFVSFSSVAINMSDPVEERWKAIKDNNVDLVYDDESDYLYTRPEQIKLDGTNYIVLISRYNDINVNGVNVSLDKPYKTSLNPYGNVVIYNKTDYINYMNATFKKLNITFIDNERMIYGYPTLETHDLGDDIILVKKPKGYNDLDETVLRNHMLKNINVDNFKIIYQESKVLDYTVVFSSNVLNEVLNVYLLSQYDFNRINDVDLVKDLKNISFIESVEEFSFEILEENRNSLFIATIFFTIFIIIFTTLILYFIIRRNVFKYEQINNMGFSKNDLMIINLIPFITTILIAYIIGTIIEFTTMPTLTRLFALYCALDYDRLFLKRFNYFILIEFIILTILVVLTSRKTYKNVKRS